MERGSGGVVEGGGMEVNAQVLRNAGSHGPLSHTTVTAPKTRKVGEALGSIVSRVVALAPHLLLVETSV